MEELKVIEKVDEKSVEGLMNLKKVDNEVIEESLNYAY